MDTATEYDFTRLPRRQLQLRCKQAGLRANTTNKEMAEALRKCAQANQANKDGVPLKMTCSTASEPRIGEHVETETGILKSIQAEANGNDTLMGGTDQDSQGALSNAGSSEGLQPGSVASLQSADVTMIAASVEVKILEEEGKQLCGALVATDRMEKPDQVASSGGMHLKGSGSLVEELLAASTCEVSGTVLHRKLAKSKHIGEKGREDRLKRATSTGVHNRSALLAKKRGGLAQAGSGSQETAPLSEDAQELSKYGEASDEAAPDKHASSDGIPQDCPVPVAEHAPATALDTAQPMKASAEELTKPSVEEAPLPLQTLAKDEHNGEERANKEASDESETESQKENEPPQKAAQVSDGDSEVPMVFKAAEQQGGELEGGSFPLSGETLLASMLAEEERAVSGQLAHKGCYKSRPFFAKGVERRVLAAVKKGAAQREGILAERRMMP